MKKTELQRLEDEVLVFEDNRDILTQFAQKLVKTFGKKHEDLEFELKTLEGGINPTGGKETHRIIINATRKFDKVSKAVVDSFNQKQQKPKREPIIGRPRKPAN